MGQGNQKCFDLCAGGCGIDCKPAKIRGYAISPLFTREMCIRDRFLLYALDGLSLAEIGVLCGCSKVAVYQSVEAVRKKFINFFESRLNE